jgi:SAM-dependent MidA family methyltransferase
MITSTQSDDNLELKAFLLDYVKKGYITFAEFMATVLYHPQWGYYTSRQGMVGVRGDFYTAPQLTPVFGQLLARQLLEMFKRLETPAQFDVVEMGAGQGTLAGDILTALRGFPEIWQNLNYSIIEISPNLREAQRARISAIPGDSELLEKVRWINWEDISPESVTGCFLSNELVDAFPVHLVTVQEGKLLELYVGLDEQDNFVEEIGPLSGESLAEYFRVIGVDVSAFETGYRTEVNLAAVSWLKQIASKLKQGYVLTIDYGYEAGSRYHPRRASGTLQCYYKHTVSSNPFVNLGNQDITAHVDFTGLKNYGESGGLKNIGLTSQAAFLGGLGIGDIIAGISIPQSGLNPKEALAQHEALMKLVNPGELGNFKVLLQGKGVSPEPPLLGFSLVF